MKIEINNVTLIDTDSANGSISTLQVNNERIIEEASFFRALQKVYFDRGNEANVVALTVTRLHADLRTAQDFVLMHGQSLPHIATIKFTCQNPGNQGFSIRYLQNAGIPSIGTGVWIGRTTTISYRFLGGLFLQNLTGS